MKVRRQQQLFLVMTSVVAIVTLMVHGVGAVETSIFEDEWFAIENFSQNQLLECPSSTNMFLRPLQGCYYHLLYAAWGIDITNYHLSMLVLRALVSLAIMALLFSLLPRKPYFVFGVALLFSVFPTTFMWPMFNLGHIFLSYCCAIAACYFFVRFGERSSLVSWSIGMVLLGVSFLFYEAGIGLVLLVTGFLLIKHWVVADRMKRLMLFLPLVLSVLFGLGRWMTQLASSSAFGHNTDQVLQNLTPMRIISRLGSGYWITLGRSWLDSLYDIFSRGQAFPYRQFFGLAAMLVALFGVILFYHGFRHRSQIMRHIRSAAVFDKLNQGHPAGF